MIKTDLFVFFRNDININKVNKKKSNFAWKPMTWC